MLQLNNAFKTLGWLLVLAAKLASSFYYAVVYKLAFTKSCLIRNSQLLYMFFGGEFSNYHHRLYKVCGTVSIDSVHTMPLMIHV